MTAVAASVRRLVDAELDSAGAILLRGLQGAGVRDYESFNSLIALTGWTVAAYKGGVAKRPQQKGSVLPASYEPSTVAMEPHWGE